MSPRPSFPLLLSLFCTVASLFLLVWLLGGFSLAAHAGTWTVCPAGPPACDYATVQEAVDAAGSGDVVKVAAGLYTDVQPRSSPPGYNGPSVITQVVYLTRSLTLRGGYTTSNGFADPPDPVANRTILDAGGQGRVLFVSGPVTVSVEGVEMRGGSAAGLVGSPWDTDAGAGLLALTATVSLSECRAYSSTGDTWIEVLFFQGSRVTLTKSTISSAANTGAGMKESHAYVAANVFTGNHTGLALDMSDADIYKNTFSANQYGGIWLMRSTATISGNTIISNSSRYGGGVRLDFDSHATLLNNLIAGNVADQYGGGVSAMFASSADLIGNRIISNTARHDGGGGVYEAYNEGDMANVDITIADNLILSNTAVSYQYAGGGGIFVSVDEVTMTGNTVSDNYASVDGGARVEAQKARLERNIIVGNQADYLEGGLCLQGGFFILVNNVIAGNQAAAISDLGFYGGAFSLLHSTVVGNYGSRSGVIVYEAAVTLTNSLITSHTVGITLTAASTVTLDGVLWYGNGANTGGGGLITVTHALTGNPAFAPDGYHLLSTSAAIDAGVDSGAPDDIDGEPRPWGMGYDLGADEYWVDLALAVAQAPSAHTVWAGDRLTFTLAVTNTGAGTLHPTVVDLLPDYVTPTGVLTWTLGALAPGASWRQDVAVTVAWGYSGTLTNTARVTTPERVAGEANCSVVVRRPFVVYLPMVGREVGR